MLTNPTIPQSALDSGSEELWAAAEDAAENGGSVRVFHSNAETTARVVLQAALPEIYCPGCRSQLVDHIFARVNTGELCCIHCAKAVGIISTDTIKAVTPDAAGWLPGICAMEPEDAIALLVSKGATISLKD